MASEDLLVIALALPPVWLSATLWWSTRHALDELRESCAFAGPAAAGVAERAGDFHRFEGSTPGSAAPPVAGGTMTG